MVHPWLAAFGARSATQNSPPRSIDQHSVERGLDAGQLRGNLLPQTGVVAQLLRLDTTNGALGLGHKAVELLVGTDIQMSEPLEELGQVLDSRVTKHFWLAIFLPTQSLGQVRHELGQFVRERLLGELYGLVETGLHPLALLLVECGLKLLQIRRRLDTGKIPAGGKQSSERLWIVGRVKQAAQPIAGSRSQLAVMLVEPFDRFVQFGLERRHLDVEAADVFLPDQPDAWLGIRQT